MLQTARYMVCSKSKHFNRPLLISLLSFSLRDCLVKTRTHFPLVYMQQSWGYPSSFSSPQGWIGWHPTAPPLFWLVPTTTWLVSITTSLPVGLKSRSITACLWGDAIALSASSFLSPLPKQGAVIPPQVSDYAELGHPHPDCMGTFQVVAALFVFCFSFLWMIVPWVFLTLPASSLI